MYNVNKDFQKKRNRYEFCYNIIIIIYGFFLLSNYIIIIIYTLFIDSEGDFVFPRIINPTLNINPSIQNNQNNQINAQIPENNELRLPNLFDNINNPRISERISFGEININQVNYFNNQISNDNNINIIPPEIEKKVINNNSNQMQLTKSLNLETGDKYFKEFEAINTESVKLKKGNICIYCKSNPAKIILSPCGHKCLIILLSK